MNCKLTLLSSVLVITLVAGCDATKPTKGVAAQGEGAAVLSHNDNRHQHDMKCNGSEKKFCSGWTVKIVNPSKDEVRAENKQLLQSSIKKHHGFVIGRRKSGENEGQLALYPRKDLASSLGSTRIDLRTIPKSGNVDCLVGEANILDGHSQEPKRHGISLRRLGIIADKDKLEKPGIGPEITLEMCLVALPEEEKMTKCEPVNCVNDGSDTAPGIIHAGTIHSYD